MKDNNNNNSKQVLLSVLGVAILVVAVVGVSFAAFSYSQTGSNVNQITTGTISMNYNQSKPTINIKNALPMTDEEGMAQTGANNVFDFSVSATIAGDATINYAVTATPDSVSGLTAGDVKVYLTDGASDDETAVGTTASGPKLVSALTTASSISSSTGAPSSEYVLDNGTFTGNGSTKNYRLRMWVDENYAGDADTGIAGGQSYGLRVNVYGRAAAQ